ncbi:hypothetical protein niasHT_032946 [Heterodera trifolii]|uniref:Uncharacterized protein n=1 Tax=Heterodera trifolii TaxID=157864 RepID=A0ABD2IXJ0_9BILA
MSDNQSEAEEKMAKAIFISADCWLCVYDLLPASQLGLGIALISHRFDIYVDEHFKTRKWSLRTMTIKFKFKENGTKEMEIVNLGRKPLPIPQIQLPRKVIGFKCIKIFYFDQNAITFLRRFRPLFDSFCPINLTIIDTYHNGRLYEFFLRNIWPIIATNIHGMQLGYGILLCLRRFVPSFLNDCPSLCVVNLCDADIFVEFPCDDNAMASDGQALAKWLFTPRPDGVPKVLKCWLLWDNEYWDLASRIEAFKAAFASASSPVNFIAVIRFPSPFADSVMPFDLTNELTREQVTLKRMNEMGRFLLIRCPIVRDESKWAKWVEEAIGWNFLDQWNRIDIHDAMIGPIDQK